MCQLLSWSIKGIASVTANQTIEKCEYILLFCGLVEELMQGIKRFKSTCVPVHRKNEYLTRKNSWPVMQQENQTVSEYDQEMPQPHTTDQPMARLGRSKEH